MKGLWSLPQIKTWIFRVIWEKKQSKKIKRNSPLERKGNERSILLCSDPRSFSNPECMWNPFSTYVSVSRPRCSFALIYRKSGIVSIIFQVPSDQASGVVEFYFQSSVLSLSHPSRVDVDRRLPITTTSFPFYIPIWWTRSCGEIKIDPWFLKFFIWKETFWWLYNLCIQGS